MDAATIRSCTSMQMGERESITRLRYLRLRSSMCCVPRPTCECSCVPAWGPWWRCWTSSVRRRCASSRMPPNAEAACFMRAARIHRSTYTVVSGTRLREWLAVAGPRPPESACSSRLASCHPASAGGPHCSRRFPPQWVTELQARSSRGARLSPTAATIRGDVYSRGPHTR